MNNHFLLLWKLSRLNTWRLNCPHLQLHLGLLNNLQNCWTSYESSPSPSSFRWVLSNCIILNNHLNKYVMYHYYFNLLLISSAIGHLFICLFICNVCNTFWIKIVGIANIFSWFVVCLFIPLVKLFIVHGCVILCYSSRSFCPIMIPYDLYFVCEFKKII